MQSELSTTLMEINKCILDEYTFWREIYEGVYSDLDVKDGVNLNIVRNHILYEKSRIEELLGDSFYLYPDSYFYPVPDELPEDFMVYTQRLPDPLIGIILNASINPPYSEVMKFSWGEVLR